MIKFVYSLLCIVIFLSCASPNKMNTGAEGFVSLFNGKNMDGWDLKIRSGDADEAKKVYSVDDGVIHVYKNYPDSFGMKVNKNATHGLFYTQKKYSRYILRFEYKWGKKIFNNFHQFQYDAGCYYHVFNDKIWPEGIEYQVRYNHVTGKNHTGDFWASNTLFQWYADTAKNQFLPLEKSGVAIAKRSGEHRGADVPHHALDNQWNTCEVIVMGNQYAIHKLNGKLVNYATDLSVGEGIIGFQSETAEIFYRNIMIKELNESIPAEEFLKKLK
jgi:Domain of Unknown Function (DUF1080)